MRLRLLYLGLTAVFLGIAIGVFVMLFDFVDAQNALGVDAVFYRGLAQRWLDTGVWYTERQLAGPYAVATLVDNLYPPHAMLLFLPFVVLPLALWWVIPISLTAWVVWRLRPAPWALAVIALVLALPKSSVVVLYGNTDLWITATVAAAVIWGWPAVLLSIKPSLALVGLLGIGRRSWWFAALVLALLSLPFAPLWIDWIAVIRNSTVTIEYSLANLPLILLPLVAWLGSNRRQGLAMPEALARRLSSASAPRSSGAAPPWGRSANL